MKKRNQTLRKKVFERDNFTCQKCKTKNKTAKILEAHHIKPLFNHGDDDINNVITLCLDCHHFAPNNEEEFEAYVKEETNGTLTTLIKAWNKVRQEHPEEFQKLK